MKLQDLKEQDQQIDELLPAVGAALGAGARAVGGAVAKGAQAVGSAVKAGSQAVGQAANAAPDPKALAMAVMQARERKDNITKQMKDIDTQIKDLQQQKVELQKELSQIR